MKLPMMPNKEREIVQHTVVDVFDAMRYAKQRSEANHADQELQEKKAEMERRLKK